MRHLQVLGYDYDELPEDVMEDLLNGSFTTNKSPNSSPPHHSPRPSLSEGAECEDGESMLESTDGIDLPRHTNSESEHDADDVFSNDENSASNELSSPPSTHQTQVSSSPTRKIEWREVEEHLESLGYNVDTIPREIMQEIFEELNATPSHHPTFIQHRATSPLSELKPSTAPAYNRLPQLKARKNDPVKRFHQIKKTWDKDKFIRRLDTTSTQSKKLMFNGLGYHSVIHQ